ncbi:MAG TPA: 50S ribosomal protein L10 [Bryobacteraceae bacterium]|jgi:Ribosomal protein L10|nr:50S ribosomal protein L10 [Bryobacteraceae bacterium]
MKNRDEKRKDFEDLKKKLEENANIFVTSFEKLTVAQDFQLRKVVRDVGGQYKVVKNNVAQKATEGTPVEPLLAEVKGMTSLAFTSGDPVALAKALTKYARDNSQFTFKAGMVEGRVIDLQGISDLATLPAKEDLYAKLLFLINASAQRLVTAINGVGRNLAVVVDQGVKENKFKQ